MKAVEITEADIAAKRWAIILHKHVVPIGDLIEHPLCESCPCDPRLEEQEDGSVIVVHHAIDQRD